MESRSKRPDCPSSKREAKVAEALRANLLKRKQQQQARHTAAAKADKE